MIEEWKIWKETVIPKFNNERRIYEISNYGRLKINGELVECKKDNLNRVYVGRSKYRMHRAVAELFIGSIPKGYVVDHIDGNPSNNRIDNLRICSQYDNIHNPITYTRYLESSKIMHDSNEYKESFNNGMKKLRESGKLKGSNNPMFGRKKHREWNEEHTKWHFVFD